MSGARGAARRASLTLSHRDVSLPHLGVVVRAPQDASESGTALWIFFWLGFMFVCLVHSAVYMGSQEAKNNKDEEE